jgi:dTDP-4-dehydrorhamnose reductase
MRILLTGAGGQLGRALQDLLGGPALIALPHRELDISSGAAVDAALEQHRPELVLNAAAYTDVDGAEAQPQAAYAVNASGARYLAIASAARGIPLLHISTDYVFDGSAARPYHEFDQPNPQSVYGASKLAGEEEVRRHNPRHYIVRTAWLYHLVGHNFPKTMLSLADRPEVRVVDDQRGCPTYAPDLAEALVPLMASGAFGTYHLAGGGAASWFEFTVALYRHFAIRTPVIPVSTEEFPRPAVRPRYSVLVSVQKLGFKLPPWQEGLARFAAELQRRPGGRP